jgi:hypothetical protein
MKGCCILSKAFFCIIEMILWYLSFILFMCFITCTQLHILSHPYVLGMKQIWLLFITFLTCCLIRFCKYFILDFSSMFIKSIYQ